MFPQRVLLYGGKSTGAHLYFCRDSEHLLTHLDGRIEKTKEHFFSPQHAEDVVKKLLQHSGMIIDNASPLAQGHLPNNTRYLGKTDGVFSFCT